jgi:hypothetical protein
MSSKSINQDYNWNYRKYFYTSNKQKFKNKKAFNYPKNKFYSEEIEYSPSKTKKENRFDNINSNLDSKNTYEDEYQGLTYNSGYPEIAGTCIYYYIERDPRDEFNSFRNKWKTEICHYWEMYGECKYGDNCAFAHGDSELKQRKMTFNYKTKPCKQFFEFGYCTYGSRCQFSHKKEEQKNDEENKNDKVSYLKIIEELLSEENKISHELVKRPRLMTFENITHCSLEESENSKLKLYEDIINLKNEKSKIEKNVNVKLSDDTNSNSNLSSDNANEK